MTINKNFVVSNGLEVNTDLIYADSETKRVGINSAIPDFNLDVNGDVSFTGALSVGGTTGVYGQWLESTGDGVQWKAVPTLRVVERYTATEGQTIFPDTGFFPFESAEFIDVFVDGVKLAQDEYNTLVGNNRIELLTPAIVGETIELVAYNATVVAAGYTGIQGLTVAEEGVVVGLSDGVKLINFVGAYITAIGSGAGVTVFLDDRLSQDTNYWLSNVSGLSTTTNVGINSANPARTLDVAGTARVTSGLEAGSVFSSGVSTFSDVVIGGATTELVVTGDARITGILTIGTSSITIDGLNNEIKIGTALTLNQSGNAYVSGIVTAQSFDGDGTNVSNVDAVTLVGLSSDSFIRSDINDSFTGTLSGTGSINITGVATASRISATTGSITNITGTNASYSGIGTVGSLNIGATQVISSGRQLQNIASLDATTTATIESAIANAPNTFTDLNVSGVGTINSLSGTDINISGVVTATSFSGSGANVTGISTLNIVNYGIGIGGGESYWEKSDVGINTLSNVGIGSTIPTSRLTVSGDVNISGVTTATSFFGSAASLTGLTGASANTYGNDTAVPQITVDANGRITGITNVLISATSGAGTNIIIDHNDAVVGTAGTINFATGFAVTPVSAGIVTVSVVGYATEGFVGLATAGLASEEFVGLSTAGLASETLVGLSTSGLASEEFVGLATAGLLSETGNGINLSGIVTSITNGSGITIDQSTGNVTISATGGGGGESYWSQTTAGIHTLSNVGVGTTNPTSALTVAGSGTSTSQLYVTGVSTFSGNVNLENNDKIILGSNGSNQAEIYGSGSNLIIANSSFNTAGDIYIDTDNVFIRSYNGASTAAVFDALAQVELYYAGLKKFETLGTGVTVTGTTSTNQLSVSGIATINNLTIQTGSGTFTASAGIAYTADSYVSSDFVNAEYTLFFQHSTGIQSQKVLVMDDGTTAYSQEYGIMSSSDLLVSVGATVKSGNVELWWTPETGVSGIITYRYTRETMI